MKPPAEAFATDGGTGPEDLILVRAALRGEQSAIEGVMGRLSCTVRFVYRLNQSLGYGLGQEQLEDVVQQVYMAVWPRLVHYAGSAALESWVYGFCRNCLRSEARRRVPLRRGLSLLGEAEEREQASAEDGPFQALERAEIADLVLAELDRLSPDEREVVQLRHLDGQSFEQIARQQDVPPSTVKDRCYRALMKLKARLQRRDVKA